MRFSIKCIKCKDLKIGDQFSYMHPDNDDAPPLTLLKIYNKVNHVGYHHIKVRVTETGAEAKTVFMSGICFLFTSKFQ